MRHDRMPSAGTMIAVLALFVALGGTGYAASESSRTSADPHDATAAARKKRKPRPVTTTTVNKLIGKFFVKNQTKLVGPAGAAGAAGATGAAGPRGPAGPSGENATRHFVQVSATNPPTASRASGVASIAGPDQTGTTGYFEVTFDRDVSACVAVGSRTSKDGNLPGIGNVSANHQGPNVIGVQTASNAGVPLATDFSLAVFC